MIDHFTILQEPRRPWLNNEALTAKFRALLAEVHPDRFHHRSDQERIDANQRFMALNAAYHCLRDPKERLRHLLELERGSALNPLGNVSPAASEFFFEVGKLCQESSRFAASQTGSVSPLLRAKFFQEGLEWSERLRGVQESLRARTVELEVEVRQFNAHWEGAESLAQEQRLDVLPLDQLEQVCRECGFLSRWLDQVQARLVDLAI